jgi:hypothetical protein
MRGERRKRGAMHGRQRNRESLQGEGERRGEGRKSSNAWQREEYRKPLGMGERRREGINTVVAMHGRERIEKAMRGESNNVYQREKCSR